MIELDKLLEISTELETAHPQDILTLAWETFRPRIVVTSSFQTQSVPLLYMISKYTPEMPVLFVDTGYHFPETIEFRVRLCKELNLNTIIAKPDPPVSANSNNNGISPFKDPDTCCMVNKVTPIRKVIQEQDAWVSGIRRDQASTRNQTSFFSYNSFYSVYKISPLANWTSRDIQHFIDKHHLPRHPLWGKGYQSIGCSPCTLPAISGKGERSGRWTWVDKIECGLHEF